MKIRRTLPVSLFLLAALFSGTLLHGQQLRLQPAASPDTAKVEIQPFPISGISEALTETYDALVQRASQRPSQQMFIQEKKEVDTLFSVIDTFMSDTSYTHFSGIGIRELDNISSTASLYTQRIGEIQGKFKNEANRIEENINVLSGYTKRWHLTLEKSDPEDLPATRVQRINRMVDQVDSVETLLQGDLDKILLQQDRLTEKAIDLDGFSKRIRDKKAELGEKLFSRDEPSLFKELPSLKDSALRASHIGQMKEAVKSDMRLFRAQFMLALVIGTILVVVLLILAIWYKTHFARTITVERFELSELHMTVIYNPVVVVLFVSALLVRFIFSGLPRTINSLNLVIMMVPMVIIVIKLFGSMVRWWMITLVSIFILTFIYELTYYPDILIRLFLLGINMAGLLLFVWMILRKPLGSRFKKRRVYQIFRIVLVGLAVMLFMALIGNLVGAVRMAEFFTLMPIQISILVIGIYVAARVMDTIIFLILASNSLQRLNVFREEFDIIYRRTVLIVNLLLWIFLFLTALSIFRVKDAFMEWGGNLMTGGFKIGEVSITPKSVLIFVFVIWLSIFLARIVRHILEKDVFTRVEVSRGMPNTIILLVRIALISGGFFLAAAAAGMELTNLSIVLGAFSVGIGFGLQNIFNNMVSGLILAFERPISVGDTVQVGELLGEVKSIGLRSSTVHSFDGADVIVPNGNLISNEMINWTKSDNYRRMDIRVGVAYGTDPSRVLAILTKVAKDHQKVNKRFSAIPYFLGFGDSSLDFRLLAWTHVDHRLEVESDLRTMIYAELARAKIEIPFPQRDLHIRSDDTLTPPSGKYEQGEKATHGAHSAIVTKPGTGRPAGTAKAADAKSTGGAKSTGSRSSGGTRSKPAAQTPPRGKKDNKS